MRHSGQPAESSERPAETSERPAETSEQPAEPPAAAANGDFKVGDYVTVAEESIGSFVIPAWSGTVQSFAGGQARIGCVQCGCLKERSACPKSLSHGSPEVGQLLVQLGCSRMWKVEVVSPLTLLPATTIEGKFPCRDGCQQCNNFVKRNFSVAL